MGSTAFLNGEFISADQIQISVTDTGFVLGVTVAEQLRTFGGQPFRVAAHLQRMKAGLTCIGLEEVLQQYDFEDLITDLARRNYPELDPADDLGINLFVTPGPYPAFDTGSSPTPTVAAFTYPLAFSRWSHAYQHGQQVAVVSIQEVPPACWPRQIKCRSRMHYYLADRAVQHFAVKTVPILVDADGFVTETPTANLVAFFEHEGLVSPRTEQILPGISLQAMHEFAERLEIPFTYRDIHPDELKFANELLLASTPFCLLPAQLEGYTTDRVADRPVFQAFLAEWNQIAGFNVVEQAARFSTRNPSLSETRSS